MKRNLIAILIFSLHQVVFSNQLEFVDIAGLVKGASKGEGLGNKFLSNLAEVDAIVHVVRCFEDSDITHVDKNLSTTLIISLLTNTFEGS